jgi:hypothetical protein
VDGRGSFLRSDERQVGLVPEIGYGDIMLDLAGSLLVDSAHELFALLANWLASTGVILRILLDEFVRLLNSNRLTVYNRSVVIAHIKRCAFSENQEMRAGK